MDAVLQKFWAHREDFAGIAQPAKGQINPHIDVEDLGIGDGLSRGEPQHFPQHSKIGRAQGLHLAHSGCRVPNP